MVKWELRLYEHVAGTASWVASQVHRGNAGYTDAVPLGSIRAESPDD